MPSDIQFTIGARVRSTDGEVGHLIWVVADRGTTPWAITHLVVEPAHRSGLGRFVPLSHVTEVDPKSGAITLTDSEKEFTQLDSAEMTEFVPGSEAYETYGPAQFVTRPYYADEVNFSGNAVPETALTVTADAPLPDGDRGVAVHAVTAHATDGSIGQVEGLVIDPGTHQVTHVLLQEGHLWGRKDVAIPLSAVRDLDDDGLQLTVTKQEIGELPPVPVARRHR
jgi:hypothetical protein